MECSSRVHSSFRAARSSAGSFVGPLAGTIGAFWNIGPQINPLKKMQNAAMAPSIDQCYLDPNEYVE